MGEHILTRRKRLLIDGWKVGWKKEAGPFKAGPSGKKAISTHFEGRNYERS